MNIEADVREIVEGVGMPINDFEGREILITGASGFLGSWFIAVFEYLNKNVYKTPCKVYAYDSLIAADKKNALKVIEDDNIMFRQSDVSNIVYKGKVDYIIHAAGIASPIFYRKFPIETIDGMVLGLSILLKFAVETGVKGFLNFSSSEMYGNPIPSMVPTPESYYGNVSATGPRSCYDESKRMGEAMCVAYHRIHNIPVNWVRPFNVYGPGMRLSDDRVVPKFMFAALQDKPITVHSPGVQTRTMCYVTDAMIGFFKALLSDKRGEVYNIGNDTPEITMEDLALRIQSMFKKPLQINKIPMPTEYPTDQAQRRCPDLTKAKAMLGYFPKISLDNGLKKMLEYCIDVLKAYEKS